MPVLSRVCNRLRASRRPSRLRTPQNQLVVCFLAWQIHSRISTLSSQGVGKRYVQATSYAVTCHMYWFLRLGRHTGRRRRNTQNTLEDKEAGTLSHLKMRETEALLFCLVRRQVIGSKKKGSCEALHNPAGGGGLLLFRTTQTGASDSSICNSRKCSFGLHLSRR